MGGWSDLYQFLGDFMFGWHATPSHASNTGGEPLPKHYAAAPLVGFRSWLIVNTPTGLALRSLHIPHTWEARRITAQCVGYSNTINTAHRAPDRDHACGVYAMLPDQDPLKEWENAVRGRVSASGSIQMWGTIIRCPRGFKAQHALIESPIVLEATCQHDCDVPPSWVELPAYSTPLVWSYCDAHGSEYTDRTRVELSAWMREAQRQLTKKYEVEVLSWLP